MGSVTPPTPPTPQPAPSQNTKSGRTAPISSSTKTTSIAEAIATVRMQSAHLNTLTNEAAKLVESVEKFLNDECNVGIASFVEVDSECSENGTSIYRYIGYCRINGRFRIVVNYEDYSGDDGPTKAWAECKREEKLATIEKLPDLIANIAKKISKHITKTEDKLKTVKDSLGFLQP